MPRSPLHHDAIDKQPRAERINQNWASDASGLRKTSFIRVRKPGVMNIVMFVDSNLVR